MKILKINDFEQLFAEPLCATIGFFDGVHTGHRFLIRQLKEWAKKTDTASAVITFSQHPRITLKSEFCPGLLTTTDEKIELLESQGIDYCFFLDFTPKIAGLTAEEFIRNILSEKLNVNYLLIGYDHRFGKNRTEGFEDYRQYGERYGIKVIQAEELSKKDHSVSSTFIRNKIRDKEMEAVAQLLSYPYSLKGKVVHGDHIGQKIGFPTANLRPEEDKIIPEIGIYAAWVYWKENRYPGMAYIGSRPTVTSEKEIRVEVHIIGFFGDLYGQVIRLEFIKFLREDQRFPSLEILKKQLERDKEEAIVALTLSHVVGYD